MVVLDVHEAAPHRRQVPIRRRAAMFALVMATAVTCAAVPPIPATAASTLDVELATAVRRHLGSKPHQVVLVRDGRVHASTANTVGGVDAPQRVASISKALTAAAVFRLVEQGTLRLDTRVVPLLGIRAHRSFDTLTVDQLLTQRSGLPSDRESWFNGRWRSCTQAASAALSRSAQSASYRYSNTNFCLLSLVIEQATGMGYDQAMDALVFTPLKMTSPVVDPDYVRLLGAGQWRISAVDLARFMCTIDLFSPRTAWCATEFLSIDSRVALIAPSSYNYARGMWRWPSGAWGHSGTLASARNAMVKLDSGDIMVVLVQSNAYASGLDLFVPAKRIAAAVGDQGYDRIPLVVRPCVAVRAR